MTMLIILSHGFYRRLERQSSGIFENSRIPRSGPEFKHSSLLLLRSSSLSRGFHFLSESGPLVSQRAHQMVPVFSTYGSRVPEPSRVFQTRVFYRRKASQQIILNIMKSVGKTLRKNLSILEVKGLGECVRKSKQAIESSLYFKPKLHFKKQNNFRSLYHGSVSDGFCKYCSDRLQKGCF